MSDVVTQNVKFIFNRAFVFFTSRVIITKLLVESRVIFRRIETSTKRLKLKET